MNIWNNVKEKILIYEKNIAFIDHDGHEITYKQLMNYVRGCSKFLCETLPNRGKLLILLNNSYYQAIYILAGLASGFTVISASARYGEKLCREIFFQTQPDLVLTDKDTREIFPVSILVDQLYEDDDFDIDCDDNEDAFIFFTSGTTGRPKGIVLSHSNVLSNLDSMCEHVYVNSSDSILIIRPLCHVAVITGELLLSLYMGMKISFFTEIFSPQRILRNLEREITVLYATPTILNYLLIYASRYKLFLKIIIISGEKMSDTLADKIRDTFKDVLIYYVYGLTEASPRVSCLMPDKFIKKKGSIGKPIANVICKIVNDENIEVNIGEIGELLVKGPNIMKEYYEDKDLTNRKIKDGWFCTGDLAYIDEDGYIYIKGRKDEMLIKAGINIYPQEIENILMEIDEIKEIVVYGKEDEDYGQKICANIVLNCGVDINKVMENCNKALADYQHLNEIHIVSELKKSAFGKNVRV